MKTTKDPRQLDLVDWITARAERDKGIELALKNERAKWLSDAIVIIANNFPKNWTGLAEEFQAPVLAKIGPPHVAQVWSALCMILIRKYKMFAHTGMHLPCRKSNNHAREGKEMVRL